MSSLSTSLKNSFDRWLTPYENYLRQAKPGVYQQLEYEYGGPLTPSPAPSPIKRSTVNTPSSLRAESPARHATDILQQSLIGTKQENDRDTIMTDAPAVTSQPTSGGFTAINSGGFTAVNSGFTSVNRPTPTDPKKGFTPPPRVHASPLISAKNTPDFRPSGLGPATALKRQLSSDSLDLTKKDNGADKDDSEGGSRRSKRLKKGMYILRALIFICTWSIPHPFPVVLFFSIVLFHKLHLSFHQFLFLKHYNSCLCLITSHYPRPCDILFLSGALFRIVGLRMRRDSESVPNLFNHAPYHAAKRRAGVKASQ